MVAETCRLYYWSPVLVREKLYFVGLKEVAENVAHMWITSKVVGRMCSRKVVTNSGKVYNLVGKPVVPGSLRDRVPVWVEEKFKLGLPRIWEEVVEQWAWVKKLETEKQGRGGDWVEFETENSRKDLASMSPSPIKLVRGIPYNYRNYIYICQNYRHISLVKLKIVPA